MLATLAILSLVCCGVPVVPSQDNPTSPNPTMLPSPNPAATVSPSVAVSPAASPAPTPGGSAPVQLPGRIAAAIGPPDGSMVVLISPGSASPEDIVAAGDSPALSPDRRRIAYVCKLDPNDFPGLCLADLDRSGAPPALVMPQTISVTWSPAADLLAIGRSPIDFGDSFLVRSDGSGLRELTMPQFETRVDVWSPDGLAVAGAASFQGGSAPVVTVCETATAACRTLGPGWTVGWSPDGAKLLVIENGAASVNLVALDVATRERTMLLDLEPSVTAAAWSRTGSIAAIGEDRSLVILDAAGGTPRRVNPVLLVSGRPVWSPDGDWLVVAAEERGITGIFVMRRDGTSLARLTTGGAARSITWAAAP